MTTSGNANVDICYSSQSHLFIINTTCETRNTSSNLSGRGGIDKFSNSAGQRMRRYLRCCEADYTVLLTLTYPYAFPVDGRESKEHLRRFLQELSREVQRNQPETLCNWSAFWFMEFQERGAIHYHLFLTHRFDKKWISKRWFDIVGSDDVRHLHAGTKIESIREGRRGMSSYASKYACKMAQKDVPDIISNCGRFWGISGKRSTVAASTRVTFEESKDTKVKKIRDSIKETIDLGLKCGGIVLLVGSKPHTEKYCRVYDCRSKYWQDELMHKLVLLQLRLSQIRISKPSIFDKPGLNGTWNNSLSENEDLIQCL